MDPICDEEVQTLCGQEAINLWLAGKEKWNAWVKENPEYNIDFSVWDFSEYEVVSFDYYHFPRGKVSFIGAQFGDGFVSFSGAQFGDGFVSFFEAQFGDGNVDFREAQFGDGEVVFSGAQFGEGNVDFREAQFGDGFVSFSGAQFGGGNVVFSGAQFGDGEVVFSGAQFGEGNVDFREAQFGDGFVSFFEAQFGDGDVSFDKAEFSNAHIRFDKAEFGEGNVDFREAQFGDGHVSFGGAQFGDGSVNFREVRFGDGFVSFLKAQFGDGDVVFSGAQFGDGSVNFREVRFGEGNVDFREAQFGDGEVVFSGAQFGDGDLSFRETKFGKGDFHFHNVSAEARVLFQPENISKVSSLIFSDSQFNSSLYFGGFNSPCVIDLRRTSISRPIDFDGVSIGFKVEDKNGLHWSKKIFNKAANSEASPCFRRLKKLAKDADDHDNALAFYASEKRSAYWHTIKGWKLAAYYIYDWVSDYGRSISRPAVGLFSCWGIFSLLYWMGRENIDAPPWASWVYSLGHSIPFYSGARDGRIDAMTSLFGAGAPLTIPDWIHAATIFQGALSSIFIFLIALGIRNLYRT